MKDEGGENTELNISFKIDDENPNQIEIVATLKGDIDGLTAVTQGLTESAKAQLEKIMQSAEDAE